jgi:3-hydroxybutyryl-CoA dehydrogenase
MNIAIIGAGAMGSGIAQVAAMHHNQVQLFDTNSTALENAKSKIEESLSILVEKNKITETQKTETISNLSYIETLPSIKNAQLVIEAIVENLAIKSKLFAELESIVDSNCILASNTSSLSIASIAGALKNKERCIGIHFFNPPILMPLVEIIPSIITNTEVVQKCKEVISSWNKTIVIAKDTPGFIVNRIARPYYGEALRIYEEGIADFATIDWAMREIGKFKMGPFELMDFIGHDVNYRVTETVFEQMFYDPRYKPSITQKRLFEAGCYGRKTKRGYYNYNEPLPQANENTNLANEIFLRIISMLINEAYEAEYMSIAKRNDIETAMKKGVNYPMGLFEWAHNLGVQKIISTLQQLYSKYNEDRYRISPLLMQELVK